MTLQFKTLREANIARLPTFKNGKGEPAHAGVECKPCKGRGWFSQDMMGEAFEDCTHCGGAGQLPPDGSDWDLDDWSVALGGEIGELLNNLKKVRRGDFTLAEMLPKIAKELADCVIYLDIISYQLGDESMMGVIESFNGLPAHFTTKSMNWFGNQVFISGGKLADEPISEHVIRLLLRLGWLANHLEIDLGEAVANKFNEVSLRVDSPVFIEGDEVVMRDFRSSIKTFCEFYKIWRQTSLDDDWGDKADRAERAFNWLAGWQLDPSQQELMGDLANCWRAFKLTPIIDDDFPYVISKLDLAVGRLERAVIT